MMTMFLPSVPMHGHVQMGTLLLSGHWQLAVASLLLGFSQLEQY